MAIKDIRGVIPVTIEIDHSRCCNHGHRTVVTPSGRFLPQAFIEGLGGGGGRRGVGGGGRSWRASIYILVDDNQNIEIIQPSLIVSRLRRKKVPMSLEGVTLKQDILLRSGLLRCVRIRWLTLLCGARLVLLRAYMDRNGKGFLWSLKVQGRR